MKNLESGGKVFTLYIEQKGTENSPLRLGRRARVRGKILVNAFPKIARRRWSVETLLGTLNLLLHDLNPLFAQCDVLEAIDGSESLSQFLLLSNLHLHSAYVLLLR